MKNYLFAPFKDDDDKIREFNAVLNALTYVIDAEETHFHESALHGLRVFIGRLESYYDNAIQDMYNNKAETIDGLLEESNLLKAENEKLNSECWCGCNDDLRAEYMELTNGNKKLKAEIRQLKADIKHDANVCESYDEGLRKEIKELRADNKRLNAMHVKDKDGLYDEVKELQAENKTLRVELDKVVNSLKESREESSRLMSQVSSKWTNNSNARTIRGEIAEYMSHNPKSSARMFLIPRNEFKNGEYDNTIYWDDGME